MADSDDKGVDDLARELDARMLADGNFYPHSVEIQNYGATGSGFAALDMITPALALLEKEREEDPEQLSDREEDLVRQTRLQTFEMLLRELFGPGSADIVDLGLTVAVWGWDLQMPPFGSMTLEQIGELAAQGRAAVCERHKRKVQRKKERAGQLGTHNPRQKRAGVIEIYQSSARGNNNRKLACAKGKLMPTMGRRCEKQ